MSAPGLLKGHLHLKKVGQWIVQGEDSEAKPWMWEGRWIWTIAELHQGVQGCKLAAFLGCRFSPGNIYLKWSVYTSPETLAMWIRCGLDLVWQIDAKRDRENDGPFGLDFRARKPEFSFLLFSHMLQISATVLLILDWINKYFSLLLA